ncbi:fused MFS/spermidine synthase [Elusimicrobiota bacterium]
MNIRKRLLYIFFLSGACGIIYELIWVRMLGVVFGNTTYSISTILAGFMAGLALGSYYFGKSVDKKQKNLLRVFCGLELGIGLYAVLTPFLFAFISKVYVLFGITEISAGSTLLVFLLGFTVILVPAFLMGGTLPVLSKYFVDYRSSAGQDGDVGINVGLLYSVNTWGAVIGSFLTGYFLIMLLGVRGTLYLASGVNIIIAGIVFYLSGKGLKAVENIEKSPVMAAKETRSFILTAVAISGFTALAYEVIWTRFLSMVLGSTIYAFATMLCAFLAGIALGSLIYTKIAGIERFTPDNQISSFGYIQAVIGISVLLLIPVFGILPIGYLKLFGYFKSNFAGFQFVQFLLAFGVMIIPTTLFGMTLPLVCRIYAGKLRAANNSGSLIGALVGKVYAANTIGAILGSILAGFALIPLMGMQKSMTLMAIINVILAIILINTGLRDRKWQRGLVISFILFFTIPYAFAVPDWNKKVINSGIYQYATTYAKKMAKETETEKVFWDRVKSEENNILFSKEGLHFAVVVEEDTEDRRVSLRINGKADASNKEDMVTQLLSGHLPVMLHPKPEKVLVVGLASGVTLGAVTRWENVKEIDCVEIEPLMVEASHYFDEWNNKPLEDERVSIILNDARSYLLITKNSYDIISSEPSNPWMTGCAPLFTRDYFKQVKSQLNKSGIFCIWLQTYLITPDDYKMIINTLKSVFPHIAMWDLLGDSLILASGDELLIDYQDFKTRFSYIADDMKRIGIAEPADLLTKFIAGEKELPDMLNGINKINTDNNPYLEFASGRNLRNHKLDEELCRVLESVKVGVSAYITDFDLHHELVRSYIENKHYPAAIQELEKSIEKSALLKESYNLLGYIYLLQDEFDMAEKMLKKSISIDARYAPARINLSQLYLKKGNLTQSAYMLKEIIKNQPENAAAYNNLGDISMRQGEYSQAERYFKKAIEVQPDFVMSYVQLGMIYLNKDKALKKAEELLKKAVNIDPASAEANYSLGLLYLRQNNLRAAEKSFNRAVKNDYRYVAIINDKLNLKEGSN